MPLWLRPWKEVREIYRKAERLKDKIRAEAAAMGIETRVKDVPKQRRTG